MKRTFTIFLLAIMLVGAVISIGIPVTPASAVSPFVYITPPVPVGCVGSSMTAVWGSSAGNVYAVGFCANGTQILPLINHYDGSTWSGSTPALPSGWTAGRLQGIWGSGASDIYAVGYGTSSKNSVPLAYHYNGSAWTQVSLPLPGGWTNGSLYGIWGLSSSNIYAVGQGWNGSGNVPLIYHYDGSAWSSTSPSLPAGWTEGRLVSLWGFSASDVHAVGYGKNGGVNAALTYHYNGSTWSSTSPGCPTGMTACSLMGVWGSGANDLYAVGDGNGSPVIYHNTGGGWTAANPSIPEGLTNGFLTAISGTSANDIYAVGYGYQNGLSLPMAYHNTGSGWNPVTIHLPNGLSTGSLSGVWASDSENIYAVGHALLYHTQEAAGVSPTTDLIDFGEQAAGTSSDGYPITITNNGSLDLVIGSLGVSGDFSIDQDLCSGQTLAAGGTCTFEVLYSPTSANFPAFHTGSITIPSNAPSSPDSIGLRGTSFTNIPGFTRIPLSLPEGWDSGILYDIWGSSANNIYAVGVGGSMEQGGALIYHNTGSGWVLETPSLPDGGANGSLNTVWGSGPEDVYAGGGGSVVYHYDGSGWNSTDLAANGIIEAIWGSGPNDIYAVGRDCPDDPWFNGSCNYYTTSPRIYHYDGSSWTDITWTVMPLDPDHYPGSLHAVWGTGAGNVYVGGEDPVFASIILHYDGSAWTEEVNDNSNSTTPGGEGYRVNGIWGSGASNVWAVGAWNDTVHAVPPYTISYNGLSYHNNGSSWSGPMTMWRPQSWEAEFQYDIWGSAAGNIYSVGCAGTEWHCSFPAISHYNGSAWHPSALPLPSGLTYGELRGVWGSGSSDIYAVGYGYGSDFVRVPLLYHTEPVEISLNPASHNFGDQGVNTTSGVFRVTLTNNGYENLSLGTLATTGEFALSGDECSGEVITPGNFCTFGVTFSPLSHGAKSGSVSIPSNAPDSPDEMSLSGNGVAKPSVTSITSDNPDPSHPLDSVEVAVNVSGSGGTPTGTVDITGADTLCSITLSAGSGSCSVIFNTLGMKMLTASYSGDSLFGSSQDTEFHQVASDAPTDISLSNNTVAENLPSGTEVGTLSTTDADPGDTHTYSLACSSPGADDASFQISGDQLQTNAVFNYETRNSYSICIRTTDGDSNSFDKNFDITVADANEPPTDISLTNSSMAENQPVATLVGTLSASDPDSGDTHTFSLACATPRLDDLYFAILGNRLETNSVFDYESQSSYTICIRTLDSHGVAFDKDFTISVTDVLETLTATFRSTGTQDGWILESGENTNLGGTMDSASTTLRLGDDPLKKQYRSVLSFATGGLLPDNAVITKVTLKVRRQTVVGGGNPVTLFQGFMLDIRRGTFGTAALQLTDWQSAAQKLVGPFTPALVSGWYSIDLTSAKAYINKLATGSGLTQIRLRFKLDDNNNTVANYLSLYSGNYTGITSRPTLVIEYYLP